MRATQAASAQRGYFLYLHKMRNRFSYFVSPLSYSRSCLFERKRRSEGESNAEPIRVISPEIQWPKREGNDVDFVDCLGHRDDVLALLQL
jgi:hypothetical protein